jgi:hypothetical protein
MSSAKKVSQLAYWRLYARISTQRAKDEPTARWK